MQSSVGQFWGPEQVANSAGVPGCRQGTHYILHSLYPQPGAFHSPVMGSGTLTRVLHCASCISPSFSEDMCELGGTKERWQDTEFNILGLEWDLRKCGHSFPDHPCWTLHIAMVLLFTKCLLTCGRYFWPKSKTCITRCQLWFLSRTFKFKVLLLLLFETLK